MVLLWGKQQLAALRRRGVQMQTGLFARAIPRQCEAGGLHRLRVWLFAQSAAVRRLTRNNGSIADQATVSMRRGVERSGVVIWRFQWRRSEQLRFHGCNKS